MNAGHAAAARRGKLHELFAIDLRSLAAFRVCVSLLILFDLAARVPSLRLHYTDQGLIPRFMVGRVLSSSPLAIHYIGGSAPWEIFLFGITGACAALLLVGLHTRAVTAALWVLMLSLLQRNAMITDAGDSLLLLLLFWSMFLPLGARWSMDAGRGRDGAVLSPASAALLLQPALAYGFAGLAKDSPAWWDGSALSQALGQSLWARPLGVWLRQQAELCSALTHFTHAFEIIGPLLLFSPLWTRALRSVGVVVFLGFQLGLAACLELNLFPFYSSVGFVAYLPGGFWRRVLRGPAAALAAAAPGGPVALPARPGSRGGRVADTCAAAALVLGILAGFGYQLRSQLLPGPLQTLAGILGIEQHWEMYRYVGGFDVRVRSRGVLEDGSGIDFATHGNGTAWEPLHRLLDSYRGRAYLERFWSSGVGHHQAFARWVCREWNARPPAGRRLARIELELEQTRLLPRGVRGDPVYEPLYRHSCEEPPA